MDQQRGLAPPGRGQQQGAGLLGLLQESIQAGQLGRAPAKDGLVVLDHAHHRGAVVGRHGPDEARVRQVDDNVGADLDDVAPGHIAHRDGADAVTRAEADRSGAATDRRPGQRLDQGRDGGLGVKAGPDLAR